MSVLNFSDILEKIGLDPKRVKLIRHALSDKGFKRCYDKQLVLEYTRQQSAIFSNHYDYWCIFISEKGTNAKFWGCYKVIGSVPVSKELEPAEFPIPGFFEGEGTYYELEHVEALAEYENRLVIDWGGATRSWHQKGSNPKPILSIQAEAKKLFCGFENLVLSYDALREIIDNGYTVYSDWYSALSSVFAIYLIVETESGHQYVGSAYNTREGLWGRWSCYIVTGGHGGNKKMVAAMAENPERCHNLQFSVLQILPKSLTDEEVIQMESLWKKKLCTKQFGWNEN